MQWDDLIFQVLQVAITVLAPILFTLLGKLIWDYAQKVQSQIPAEQLAFAKGLIKQLVLAAEQSGLTGQIREAGEEKRKYVIDLAEKELKARGIDMDLDVLYALLEAAVFEAFTNVKEDKQPE